MRNAKKSINRDFRIQAHKPPSNPFPHKPAAENAAQEKEDQVITYVPSRG